MFLEGISRRLPLKVVKRFTQSEIISNTRSSPLLLADPSQQGSYSPNQFPAGTNTEVSCALDAELYTSLCAHHQEGFVYSALMFFSVSLDRSCAIWYIIHAS